MQRVLRRLIRLALLPAFILAAAIPGFAQTYPTRPVTIVLPSAAGGGQDALARQLAEGMSAVMAQQVVVVNRPSVVGQQSVMAAPADGHTLLFDASTLTMLPFLVRNAPFDPEKDFTPITQYAKTPYVMAINPSLGIRNLRELIAYAKANPNKVAWGVAGVGTPDRLAVAQFADMAGISILLVPFRGGGPALISALANDVHAVMLPAASVRGPIETGKLIALGTTATAASSEMPSVPPISGTVPNFEFYSWYGLWGPKGMPAAVTAQIRAAAQKVAINKEFAERMSKSGYETIISETPDFIAFVKSEIVKNGTLIKSLNIKQ